MKKTSHFSAKKVLENKLEIRRKRAAAYFLRDKKVTWIANELGVSRVAVHQWKKRWRENGLSGLKHAVRGRTSRLTEHEEKILCRDLSKDPKEFGYRFERWTLKNITFHVKKKLRVLYAERSLWHVLHRDDFVRTKRLLEKNSSVQTSKKSMKFGERKEKVKQK